MAAAAQSRITYRPVANKPVPFKFSYLLGKMWIGCAQQVPLEFLLEIAVRIFCRVNVYTRVMVISTNKNLMLMES